MEIELCFMDFNIIFVFKTTVTRAEAAMEAAQAWALARSVVDSVFGSGG